jgi:outer membrane protein assembly factor BamE (lipoprotein component of BamABCDE complex)
MLKSIRSLRPLPFVLLAAVLAMAMMNGCKTLKSATYDETSSTYQAAYESMKAGVTAYEDVVERFGKPMDRVQLKDGGFACRWQERSQVRRSATNSSRLTLDPDVHGYSYTMTVVTTLEVFFDDDGLMRDLRITRDMP